MPQANGLLLLVVTELTVPASAGNERQPFRTHVLLKSRSRRGQGHGSNMRRLRHWMTSRCVLLICAAVLCLICLLSIHLPLMETDEAVTRHVSPQHKKLVHDYVNQVLGAQCLPSRTRKNLLPHLPSSSHMTQPFLWKDDPLSDDLFLYPPPFGFQGLQSKVEQLLQYLPRSDSAHQLRDRSHGCQRCVVVGNGGILSGLELGALIDRFDVVIRLNSGPLGEYAADVGNRTTIRMSYPEGTPLHWVDSDPDTVFVAVVYKGVDVSWTSAMINRIPVPLWDWLFFWQKVPDHIPLDSYRFRLLNPQVIRETALDLLHFPPPRRRLWGSEKNVPTMGLSALTLASLLCDEVSLAGFGYNFSVNGAPLHYYDKLPTRVMQQQKSHNVKQETEFLQKLVREGAITDLTGGIHCTFCPR